MTLSAYLEWAVPDGGADTTQLTEDIGRAFVADLTRRAQNGQSRNSVFTCQMVSRVSPRNLASH